MATNNCMCSSRDGDQQVTGTTYSGYLATIHSDKARLTSASSHLAELASTGFSSSSGKDEHEGIGVPTSDPNSDNAWGQTHGW